MDNACKFVVKSYRKDKKSILFFLLSPTFFIAAFTKDKKETKEDVRKFLIRRNWQYFCIAPLLALTIYAIRLIAGCGIAQWLITLGGLYAFSRVNEIFIAFVKDATSHLRKMEHSSNLKYYERIPLAMRSYIELIILYGVIAFVLHSLFHSMSCGDDSANCALNMWQAIYYSGVTITTLGYGEITPNDFMSQLIAIYEVINGFSLIVVSFAVYVSRSVSSEEYKNF
jgi:voltage-gated potassium channel